MKRVNVALALCCLAIAGCSQTPVTQASGGKPPAETPSTPNIVGRYALELEKPKEKTDNPAEALGQAFGSIFASGMELEIKEGDKFTMSLMGVPVEGKVTVTGDNIKLDPEKVFGMTEEELKKQGGKNKDFKMEDAKMEGTIEENGDVLRLKSKEGSATIFRRKKVEPEAPAEEKVTTEEKPFVGEWKISEVRPPKTPTTEQEKAEQQTVKAMLSSTWINLRQDNTFHMRMLFEFKGNWKKEGETLVLLPTEMMGMSGGSSKEPMKLKISGHQLIMDSEKEGAGQIVLTKS